MRFTKMQGLGNDYIYLNCLEAGSFPGDPGELTRRLSDRHFGIGGDGVIFLLPGRSGDFSMEIYNADGSRGEMCGNGLRCLGRYISEQGLSEKRSLTIDTGAGPRRVELLEGGLVRADMGSAFLFPEISLEVEGTALTGTPVSVGNPHLVLFCEKPESIPLERLGPKLERHPLFPGGTNVEFCHAEGERLRLRVWERGSGATLACGTGACACFAAAMARGMCQEQVKAELPGGELSLSWEPRGEHIWMEGPAVTVFQGEWSG